MIKIGMTGSSGTGKTTLAKALADHFGVPYVSEGVRSWLKKRGYSSPRDLGPEESLTMQTELLDRKIQIESKLDSFIACRTTIDNMVYALRWLSCEPNIDGWISEYIVKCIKHANKTYDMIFVLPWGVLPMDDDGCRSNKQFYQYSIQMLAEGIITNHPGIHAKTKVITEITLEARVFQALIFMHPGRLPKIENVETILKMGGKVFF